jgi:tryptophanyl-tRNA synthetase
MAADILLYDATIVPVGKDQKQHVEIAKDIAGSFNAIFGPEVLVLPEPVIEEKVMTIPGLDGRKMSKSYGNEIPFFSDSVALKKLVMSITTDSSALEESKELDGTLVGALFELVTSSKEYTSLRERLWAGGYGWGHAKLELFERLEAKIKPLREEYLKLRTDESHLKSVLTRCAEQARVIGDKTLRRVRSAVGIR